MLPFVLMPGERVVKTMHQSKLALLPYISLFLLAIIIPWRFIGRYSAPNFISTALKIWFIAWSFWLLWHLSRFWLEKYILTNKRLIAISRPKPLEKLIEETPLERILNIGLEKKGVLEMFFGLGTVLVHAVGLEEPLKLKKMPKAGNLVRNLWQENQKVLEMKNGQGNLPEGLMQTRSQQRLD